MFKFVFKKAAPLPKIKDFDRYLFIGPHPDDIEVGCGGTVAALSKMGKTIRYVVVTDGSVGSIDRSIDSNTLKEIRIKEQTASAELLGVTDIHFLGYSDGSYYNPKDVEVSIMKEILDFKPDVVFFPDPCNRVELHQDHLVIGRCSSNAVMACEWEKITNRYNLDGYHMVPCVAMYFTDKPNQYFKMTKYEKLKMEAIGLNKTQYNEDTLKTFKLYFSLRDARFGLRCFSRKAEGYKVLGLLHRHCFPETSEY